MKITSIEAIPFEIPYLPEYGSSSWSSGGIEMANHVLITVKGEDGRQGYGEAMPRPVFFGENQRSIVIAVEEFYREALMGMDVMDAEKIQAVLDRFPGNYTARGALDVAIHDLKTRFLGVPLYKLLGGWAEMQRVPVAPNISLKTRVEEAVEDALKYLEMGMKTFKVKVGTDPQKDVKVVHAIRKALGDGVEIYVDANQGWDRKDALWALGKMVEEGVFVVEEPLPSLDHEGKRQLIQVLPITILLDESVISVQDVAREIKLGIAGRISIKTPRTGIINSRKIVQMTEAYQIKCIIGTQAETGVGTIASAHNAASYRNIVSTELGNYLKWADDLLTTRPRFEDGFLILPEGPGLGIEIDEEKLAKYRTDR